MKKLIAITIGIIGLSACTPAQIQQAIDTANTVATSGPTIDIQATCDGGLTITTTGYPDGQMGMFSIGGEPPRQLVLNSVSHTDWPEYMTDRSYLIFTEPGDPNQVYAGDPDCAVED